MAGQIRDVKKAVQKYWGEFPPGLDVGVQKGYPVGSREFYLVVDQTRYYFEPYIIPFIDSVAVGGELMLEVGCGLGSDLRQFAKRSMKVVGVDLSPSNASFAKRGAELLGFKVCLLAADAEDLPFKSDSFDLVYSFGVLHHTPDTKKAVDEVFRVLKWGGKALVMLYHTGAAYWWIMLVYGLLKFESLQFGEEELLSKRYDHTPLSKMYTKRRALDLFKRFTDVEIECISFGGIQANKKLKWWWFLLNRFHFLMRTFGSFLIIKAEKQS